MKIQPTSHQELYYFFIDSFTLRAVAVDPYLALTSQTHSCLCPLVLRRFVLSRIWAQGWPKGPCGPFGGGGAKGPEGLFGAHRRI